MELRAFRLTADGAPEPVEPEAALQPRDEGADADPFWIDIERPERERARELLDRLSVAPVLRGEIMGDRTTPLAVGLVDQTLVRLPAQLSPDAGECPVAVLLLPGRIVTLHEEASDTIHELANSEIDASGLRVGTPTALLVGLTDLLVQRDLDLVSDFRGNVDRLSAMEVEDLADLPLEEMVSLRQQGEVLTAMLEDQIFCLSAISAIEMPAPDARDLKRRFLAAHGALAHVARILERAMRRLEQILEQRSLHAQDSANRRLKVLTVVQAVFVPLTLITGIYGMNFQHMPELGWSGAYFVALGAMVTVASISLVLFWRHGWFD